MLRERERFPLKSLILVVLAVAISGCVRLAPISQTPYDQQMEDLNRRLWWELNGDLKPLGALKRSLEESRKLQYLSQAPDAPWKTPKEVSGSGGGDCKNLAVWTISRVWELSPGADIKLVVGSLKFRGGHAWVELHLNGQVWWADPTVRQGKRFGLASSFHDRIAKYAYAYDGLSFNKKYAYL
ncbi:MAG TPA: hypothetical protein VEU07_05745 [Candidatus Acidoferrum sp.]|nr:hypothetical protein [Candidatus Acidoferrum sp.]